MRKDPWQPQEPLNQRIAQGVAWVVVTIVLLIVLVLALGALLRAWEWAV